MILIPKLILFIIIRKVRTNEDFLSIIGWVPKSWIWVFHIFISDNCCGTYRNPIFWMLYARIHSWWGWAHFAACCPWYLGQNSTFNSISDFLALSLLLMTSLTMWTVYLEARFWFTMTGHKNCVPKNATSQNWKQIYWVLFMFRKRDK